MAGYSGCTYGSMRLDHPFEVVDRRRHIDVSDDVVNAATTAAHEFQEGPTASYATKAATKLTGSGTQGNTEARKASQLLREFLSNPKVVELLNADNKFVNYAELDQFCKELDYVDELCHFTKTMAIEKLTALRGVLANKRKRPGRGEWITMSGAEADAWVATLRKCIAVIGLK